MSPCRGRRRGRRWITEIPPVRSFLPEGVQGEETKAVILTLEELEAVRLADLLDLDQEEAAFYMGVSRKAYWNDLASARRKIATALVYGTGIRIEGGSYILREQARCEVFGKPCPPPSISREEEAALVERELRVLKERLSRLEGKIAGLEPEKDL